MKQVPDESALIAQSIMPLLKTFTSSGIAILGCHSARTSRPSCEYDLLIIGKEVLGYRTMKVGDTYLDVLFRDADELTKADPEFLASLATLVPLRDTSLLLGSAKTAARKGFQTNCRAAASKRLTSALKSVGRASHTYERRRTGLCGGDRHRVAGFSGRDRQDGAERPGHSANCQRCGSASGRARSRG